MLCLKNWIFWTIKKNPKIFQIFAEEKETADILVSLSRQSSESGRGTLTDTQPSTPQPDTSLESPLIAEIQAINLTSSGNQEHVEEA